jgi:hypothetical protein
MTPTGKNRIIIFGPKDDGHLRCRVQNGRAGEALAISIPRTETAVIRHFQERMLYGYENRYGTRYGTLLNSIGTPA